MKVISKISGTKYAVLMALVLGCTSTASAACKLGVFTEQNTYSLPGCPTDVKELVARMYGCDHWAGEEPYDAERAEEITAALKELRCESYRRDYKLLEKKYKGNAAISRVLKDALPVQQ